MGTHWSEGCSSRSQILYIAYLNDTLVCVGGGGGGGGGAEWHAPASPTHFYACDRSCTYKISGLMILLTVHLD